MTEKQQMNEMQRNVVELSEEELEDISGGIISLTNRGYPDRTAAQKKASASDVKKYSSSHL